MINTGSRTKSWFLRLAWLAAAVALVTPLACGDDGEDAVALCKKGCAKLLECTPEVAPFIGDCDTSCQSATKTETGQRCTNESAIVAKFNQCLASTCEQLQSCLAAIPPCTGGSTAGTGGSSGTGGTSGTGGSSVTVGVPGTGGTSGSGGADCSICAKADACCAAIAAQTGQAEVQCTFAQQCAMAGAATPTAVQLCQSTVNAGSQANIAACK
jgi:uncharacterized membrane protein YgcG